MDLNTRPPWSNKALGRLGAALREGSTPPTSCPDYNDVMLWNVELAAHVQQQIERTSWSIETPPLVTSRAKTIDTLVQKLHRQPTLQLDRVQDLAGVRVDANMLLDEQTALAREIAEHFGADESAIHDLREDPHAGYRAVHVWLRMPAGRVEIQIRTTLQSLWANTYEGLGDALGRGIRYGDPIEGDQPIHGVPAAKVREVIEAMHRMSAGIARLEAGIEAIQEGYPQKVAAIMAAMARLQASLDSAVARESG